MVRRGGLCNKGAALGPIFNGATFRSIARFPRCTFNGEAQFNRALFEGSALFDHVTAPGSVTFDYAQFVGKQSQGKSPNYNEGQPAIVDFSETDFSRGLGLSCVQLKCASIWVSTSIQGGLTVNQTHPTRCPWVYGATVDGAVLTAEALGWSATDLHTDHDHRDVQPQP